MNDLIAQWHHEHMNFASLLDLLEEQVAVFQGGEQPDYELMLDIVSYLREAPDRFHHPREDVMLARLSEREPGLQVQIARLLQEHRVIALAGEELRARLDEVISGGAVRRTSLETAAALYVAYYRVHLATQERNILPRAREALTAADWARVEQAVATGPDPLFGEAPQTRYRGLRAAIQARAERTERWSRSAGAQNK